MDFGGSDSVQVDWMKLFLIEGTGWRSEVWEYSFIWQLILTNPWPVPWRCEFWVYLLEWCLAIFRCTVEVKQVLCQTDPLLDEVSETELWSGLSMADGWDLDGAEGNLLLRSWLWWQTCTTVWSAWLSYLPTLSDNAELSILWKIVHGLLFRLKPTVLDPPAWLLLR